MCLRHTWLEDFRRNQQHKRTRGDATLRPTAVSNSISRITRDFGSSWPEGRRGILQSGNHVKPRCLNRAYYKRNIHAESRRSSHPIRRCHRGTHVRRGQWTRAEFGWTFSGWLGAMAKYNTNWTYVPGCSRAATITDCLNGCQCCCSYGLSRSFPLSCPLPFPLS